MRDYDEKKSVMSELLVVCLVYVPSILFTYTAV